MGQDVLESLDGIAYAVGLDGEILAIGRRNWDAAVSRAKAPEMLCARHVIGRNLFDFIAGDEVIARYRGWMVRLTHDPRPVVFAYQSSAPDIARKLRMSITRLEHDGILAGLLFHSTSMLFREYHASLSAYGFGSAPNAASLPCSSGAVVPVCSFCQRFNWLPASRSDAGTWLTAEQYYETGGWPPVRATHCICPECAERLPQTASRSGGGAA